MPILTKLFRVGDKVHLDRGISGTVWSVNDTTGTIQIKFDDKDVIPSRASEYYQELYGSDGDVESENLDPIAVEQVTAWAESFLGKANQRKYK